MLIAPDDVRRVLAILPEGGDWLNFVLGDSTRDHHYVEELRAPERFAVVTGGKEHQTGDDDDDDA
jgi:hypothetical protein